MKTTKAQLMTQYGHYGMEDMLVILWNKIEELEEKEGLTIQVRDDARRKQDECP